MKGTSGKVSVRGITCPLCGEFFSAGRTGPLPDNCHHCRPISNALVSLEKELPRWAARASDECLIDLRHRLFCLVADEVPRPRDSGGRFVARKS